MPQHRIRIAQTKKYSPPERVETTKLDAVIELIEYCKANHMSLDGDIRVECQPSLFIQGDIEINVRAWTK